MTNAHVLSSSPEGYEPFHIEHYGRHGSRWLTADELYLRPVDYLRQADMKGKLTERGRLLLKQLIFVSETAKNKAGELTPLGHRQHRQIARRMVKNFPEIYRAGNYVNANSTVVIRCILSMASEIAELKAIEPGLNVKCDASMETQNTLNYNHLDIPAQQLIATATSELSKNFLPVREIFHHLLNWYSMMPHGLKTQLTAVVFLSRSLKWRLMLRVMIIFMIYMIFHSRRVARRMD